MLHLWAALLHWLAVQSGTYIPPGQYSDHYNFWSGAGSDIGEITIIGMIYAYYRQHKCETCWRPSKHDVAGTHFKTCHKHFTPEDHARLQALHKKKFPIQHAFHIKKKKEDNK